MLIDERWYYKFKQNDSLAWLLRVKIAEEENHCCVKISKKVFGQHLPVKEASLAVRLSVCLVCRLICVFFLGRDSEVAHNFVSFWMEKFWLFFGEKQPTTGAFHHSLRGCVFDKKATFIINISCASVIELTF